MTRLLQWFSIERTSGLVMLAFAGLLILRPFAFGLEVLSELYSVEFPVRVLIGWMFLSGIALLVIRRTAFIMFVILLLPKLFYSLCLFWVFLLSETVGPFGFAYGLLSCGLWLYIHTRREQPLSEVSDNFCL